MKRFWLSAVSVAMLSGCGGGDSATPTGQVVATVDGQEITQADLSAELSTVLGADPNKQPELRDQALQALVNRALLAEEAKRAGLDEGPAAAIAKRRLEQVALIDRLQGQARSQVPMPSVQEAQNYVTQNPAAFSQRRILLVDQFIARNVPQDVVRAMAPLRTMEEISALLAQRNIPFQRAVGVIDGLTANPDLLRQVVALPANEVFIIPEGDVVRINRIRDTVIEPVTGQDAVRVARERLAAIRGEEAVRERMENIISTNSGNVKYNAEYQPKAAAKAAAPGTTPAAK